MSWDPYIDNIIQQCPSVTKGTIIGLNGSIWTPATAANPKILAITQHEATTLAAVMCKKSCDAVAAALPAAGITVEGTRYMFLRDMDGDGRIVTAKKSGVGNLIAQSTTQGIIIAFIPESNAESARQANIAVDKIAKYLESSGY